LYELTRRDGSRVEVHDGNAGDDREDAAVAAEDSVGDLIVLAAMEQRFDELQPAAAKRTSKDVECGGGHDRATGSAIHSRMPSPAVSIGARRNGSRPSQRRASDSSIQTNGLCGPICVRWQRSASS